MANDEMIYILDQVMPKPGQGEVFYNAYMAGYAPLAQARGMTLEHCWVNPPMWLEREQSNTLYIVWSVKGVAGFWVAGPVSRTDPAAADWWRDAEPMIETRRRAVLGEAADIGLLTDV